LVCPVQLPGDTPPGSQQTRVLKRAFYFIPESAPGYFNRVKSMQAKVFSDFFESKENTNPLPARQEKNTWSLYQGVQN
jgi:hypothetical protein